MSSPVLEQQMLYVRSKPISLATKRLIDVVGALFALIILSPTLLVIAILIKFQDGGPVIHRRRVVGSKGEFDLFKFRSMCVNADDILRSDPNLWVEYQKNFKLVNDPRVTRLGRFIRRTSLDELPQLFNVLFGQMSLIGPRSITSEELERYGSQRDVLLRVRPGLSGYWQTEGRSLVSYQERVQMELYYVQNWSLLWDLRILFKTPQIVLKGEGAH